jgi:hypothetical protein
MAIQHRMDRTDRGALRREHRVLSPEPLTGLGRAPGRIFLLQPDDQFLGRQRQLLRVALRSPTPIGQAVNAAAFVPVVNFVARFPRNPEFRTKAGSSSRRPTGGQ